MSSSGLVWFKQVEVSYTGLHFEYEFSSINKTFSGTIKSNAFRMLLATPQLFILSDLNDRLSVLILCRLKLQLAPAHRPPRWLQNWLRLISHVGNWFPISTVRRLCGCTWAPATYIVGLPYNCHWYRVSHQAYTPGPTADLHNSVISGAARGVRGVLEPPLCQKTFYSINKLVVCFAPPAPRPQISDNEPPIFKLWLRHWQWLVVILGIHSHVKHVHNIIHSFNQSSSTYVQWRNDVGRALAV
jgi:hypothetical protein